MRDASFRALFHANCQRVTTFMPQGAIDAAANAMPSDCADE